MDEHFGLNLLSLNDSVTSSASAAQELYSNSNLNSASSLSWADDEVENYATFRVQNCLEDLEEYLLNGRQPDGRCFDLKEAAQWRGLVDNYKFQELLSNSRREIRQEKLQKHPSARRELEIHGHSFIHSPTTKFGSPIPAVYTQHSFQTPRIRSAYPIKSSNQPTRVRSAYPLSKSSALPGVNRMGARSGHVLNHRSHTLKNPDSFKMLEDTARLTLNNTTRTSSPTKSHIQFNKRIKLLPPSLPKFEESLPPSSVLPPLNQSSPPVRNKSRSKTVIPTTSKIRSPNIQSNSTRMKPTSAAQQRSKVGHYRPFIMQPPSTFRATTNRQQHDNIEVSIVGTSLNLFEPISRPVRSVTIPKLRNI